MSTYSTSLQHALDNIFYMDRNRISLKSTDRDVLEIFSGDEKAVIQGLREFHLRHQDKSVTIHDGSGLEVKVFDLFKHPDQENQKINWKKNHRWKEGKFPQGKPFRRENSWKR